MDRRPSTFRGSIRPLRTADLPAVERILQIWVRDAPSSPPLDDEIYAHLARMAASLHEDCGHQYLVAATEEEEIVGVVGMRPPTHDMLRFASMDRPIEMINTYLDSRHRGYGVGTALVRQLERLAREHGYSEMIVNSGPRYQDSGWGFYDKVGYERRGIVRNLYGQGTHAPVWSKIL